MPARTDQLWTTRRLLTWMTDAFTRAELDSPRLCAELLVSHVIGCERLQLYMDVDRPATALERESLRELTGRALKNEPIQYLVGEAWFFSLPFHADKRGLIPRPSSETIVETVLQQARARPALKRGLIADICTGSGCLAISLLKNLPEARAIATDISPEALELARLNASRHGVLDRLELLEGDLLTPLRARAAPEGFHCLVANPPYIPDTEWVDVPANVKDYEPEGALRGGADGLCFVKPLLNEAPEFLVEDGLMVIEVASSTAPDVLELARAQVNIAEPRIEADLEGHDRVLVAMKA